MLIIRYYCETKAEHDFRTWLDSVCIHDALTWRSPAYVKREQLERLLDKEKRLERLIKNRQRYKRKKARQMESTRLSIEEVADCLQKRMM